MAVAVDTHVAFISNVFAWLMRVTSLNDFVSIRVQTYAPKSPFAFLGKWLVQQGHT